MQRQAREGVFSPALGNAVDASEELVRAERSLHMRKLGILALLTLVVGGLYLSVGVADWAFSLPFRGRKLMAMRG